MTAEEEIPNATPNIGEEKKKDAKKKVLKTQE